MNAIEARRYAQENPEAAQQAQQAMQALLSRSATDLDFRNRLLADPSAAIAEHTGQASGTANVVFVENTADATIVLPDFVGDAELSEEELEAVAGGTDIVTGVLVGILILEAGIAVGLMVGK